MARLPWAWSAATVLAGLRIPSMSYTDGSGAGPPSGRVAPVPMSPALLRFKGWSISHCHGTLPAGACHHEAVVVVGGVVVVVGVGSVVPVGDVVVVSGVRTRPVAHLRSRDGRAVLVTESPSPAHVT